MTNTTAETIGKLLAKAERTDNPHEAEAFTRKAEALMVKLGIDEAMARQAAGQDVRPETIIERRIRVAVEAAKIGTWYPDGTTTTWACVSCDRDLPVKKFPTTGKEGGRGRECRECRDSRVAERKFITAETNAYNREHVVGWHTIAKALGSDLYFTGNYATAHLVGFESDVARIEMLVTSLKTQATLALWTWWKAEGDEANAYATDNDRTKARRDFVVSFYVVVARRLREQTKQTIDATPGAALALRDKAAELKDHMEDKDLRTTRGRSYSGSDAGADAGRRANLGGSNAVGGGHRAIGR
ncbi:DUF2786 domain-containing protein [Nocardioides sp. STR2]|uniref:DUF2786 domain-containing protein n=1 Tax=Nocardioides pini TaxID=2975053 RepID=A0ABT4CCI7_9ACTN|nr:DUF2786 domain-containing protein [Nocardioides pini]MCY4726680.1 DUF2786 domain-containing protein [Nocardioides pini]